MRQEKKRSSKKKDKSIQVTDQEDINTLKAKITNLEMENAKLNDKVRRERSWRKGHSRLSFLAGAKKLDGFDLWIMEKRKCLPEVRVVASGRFSVDNKYSAFQYQALKRQLLGRSGGARLRTFSSGPGQHFLANWKENNEQSHGLTKQEELQMLDLMR